MLSFNNDAFLEAISFLKGAYAEDAAWVGLQKSPYDYFARRQALAYEGTLDDLLVQEGFTARAGSGDEFTTLPYPSPDGSGSISLETLSVGIRAGSNAEQLGAWLFARWLLSAPAQEALVHVSGYWPAAGDPNAIAPDYARQPPAWASALQVGVRLQLAPERENWAFSPGCAAGCSAQGVSARPGVYSHGFGNIGRDAGGTCWSRQWRLNSRM